MTEASRLLHRPVDVHGTNGAYYVQRVAQDNVFKTEIYLSPAFSEHHYVIIGKGHTQMAAAKAALVTLRHQRRELRKLIRAMRWLRLKLLLAWLFRRKHRKS